MLTNKSILSMAFSLKSVSRTISTKSIVKELQIPVPWGHIAAKEWGQTDGEPWIAVHGFMDNCGSFNALLPYFPKSQRIIAIDLPGCGLSSHFPQGVSYHYQDGLQYIRRVANNLNLKKFSLIGHSMGAGMSLMYSAAYPEHVNNLVMIEGVNGPKSFDSVADRSKASIEDLLYIERKINTKKEPQLTYNQALKKLIEGTQQLLGHESITENSAKMLLERGIKKVSESDEHEDKWVFTRDLRHIVRPLYGYPQELSMAVASEVKCPHLLITAKSGFLMESPETVELTTNKFKQSNHSFQMVDVEGNHHVHLNTPENVWPHIASFLGYDKNE